METLKIYDDIVKQVMDMNINTDELSDDVSSDPIVNEIEKQKVYVWIRLYLKEGSNVSLNIGDDFTILYNLTGESMNSKFVYFGKKVAIRDSVEFGELNTSLEDDKNILCLMVDEEYLRRDDIPFLRSLFKTSPYFTYQVYNRENLIFTNLRTLESLEYVDCEF
jgi:hypothetical protein